MKTAWLATNSIIYNPLRRSRRRILPQLEGSIRLHGIVNPIQVDKNYVIIDGNMRLEAAKRLGIKEIPAAIYDYDSNLY